MATTNANESRAKDNFIPRDNTYRTRENNIRSNNDFSRNNEHRSKDNAFRNKENNFKPRDNQLKTRDNQLKPRDNQFKPFKPRENNTKQMGGYAKDKDEDSDIKNTRRRKSTESKAKNSITKDLEQPDKLETIKRLEREKKVIQKKSREVETEKPKRPIIKEKRSTKEWTKDYEYGLLDEEEVF